jgi:hypothetical protein
MQPFRQLCLYSAISILVSEPLFRPAVSVVERFSIMQRQRRWLLSLASLAVLSGLAAINPLRRMPLSETESACVGTWTYLSPDRPAQTRIVYYFHDDRRATEEHYYLTSATPHTPRIRFHGRWHVEHDRLLVEPSRGIRGATVSASGVIREALGDSERWARPVLSRIYRIKTTEPAALMVECQRSGKNETVQIVMEPFVPETHLPASHP